VLWLFRLKEINRVTFNDVKIAGFASSMTAKLEGLTVFPRSPQHKLYIFPLLVQSLLDRGRIGLGGPH
jgi:hypothetical protein